MSCRWRRYEPWATSDCSACPFPEPYGSGGDLTGLCIAIEEIARVDQSLAITLEAGVGLGANPDLQVRLEGQRERWLPDLCAGRALGAFGLTEPDAGSDAGGTRTLAELDGGRAMGAQRREGLHHQLGHADDVDGHGSAMTAPREISAFLVPAGTPGFTVLPPYRKMGWHASDTHGLAFVDCRMPVDHLLGTRGRGLAQFLEVLDEGRVAIAALAVGVIRRCLEDATRHASERMAFGRPIGANQAVAFRCADMHVALAAATQLTYHAGLAA